MSKLLGQKGFPQDVVDQAELPSLTGTEKQVEWAGAIRRDKLQRLLVVLRGWQFRLGKADDAGRQQPEHLAAQALFEQSLQTMVRLEEETHATWWIDHREQDVNGLLGIEA